MDYDVIGDIHGQGGMLHALLRRLGYVERGGAYRHPNRCAVFVGDFIDRGPQQVDAVMTVRRMVDCGSSLAIMGNHEFNAIAWHTPDPLTPGETLRPRRGRWGESNRRQHAAFLAEVEDSPALHTELVEWFLTLPLWLDLPGIRVVHACWHSGYMAELEPKLRLGARLDRELVAAASREGGLEFRAVEALTKGLEIDLPDGHAFSDKDGIERRRVRLRWWDTTGRTYRDLAAVDEDLRQRLPTMDLETPNLSIDCGTKPVFFGHYWMSGLPAPLSNRAVCVDYSAGKGGPLTAYRWDGEERLDRTKFVSTEE